ncbi:hypothetical protein [Sulfuricurvum sp.]|uniref:hypothetical protein n=1 Tax=Sulfuricurvum sp. TaxID=2025608 RepID=UPI0026145A5E|nr:hypothetical protein [Sulfuricurvum sp.]MDD4949637.1 hypothetical protein [Sulfuricurvum sp.]
MLFFEFQSFDSTNHSLTFSRYDTVVNNFIVETFDFIVCSSSTLDLSTGYFFLVDDSIFTANLDLLLQDYPEFSVITFGLPFPYELQFNSPLGTFGSNFTYGFGAFKDSNSIISYFGIQSPAPTPLLSLDGENYSYKDNESVWVYPENRKYTVKRSYLMLSGNRVFSPVYELQDVNGDVLITPMDFVTNIDPTTTSTP